MFKDDCMRLKIEIHAGSSEADYWAAMRHVYCQCYAVLPVGGHLVLVVMGMIRQGRYVDTPTQTAALLKEVGFVVQHWYHAMLTAREAQLTFDGREERQRHLSFFRRACQACCPRLH